MPAELVTEATTEQYYKTVLECSPDDDDDDDDVMTFIDKHAGDGKTLFQAQLYGDPGCWTAPLPLTEERAECLKADNSVSQVKFILKSKL